MGKECEVSPYSSESEAVWNIPVVTGAMVWMNPMDGTAYLLVFQESLWMGDKLDHTLVNPNQLRAYSVSIQDSPFDTKPLSITADDVSVEFDPISSGLTVSVSRTTLSTPSLFLSPPMMSPSNCIQRERSSEETLECQQNPSWANSHGSF